MAQSSDRRKRVRVPVKKNLRHSRYQVLGTPVFEENSSIDISSGGISFQAGRRYKKGSLVLLEVEIDSDRLKILVCVAWVKKSKQRSDRFELGGELIAIDPVHKRKLQRHIQNLLGDEVPSKRKAPAKKAAKKKAVKKEVVKKKLAQKKAAKKSSPKLNRKR